MITVAKSIKREVKFDLFIPEGWTFDKYDIPWTGEHYLCPKYDKVVIAGYDHDTNKQIILKEVK